MCNGENFLKNRDGERLLYGKKNELFHVDTSKKHTLTLLFYFSSYIYHILVQTVICYLYPVCILLELIYA